MSLSYSEEELKKCIERLKTNYKDWGCYTKEIIYFTESCSICKCKHNDPRGGCHLDYYSLLT